MLGLEESRGGVLGVVDSLALPLGLLVFEAALWVIGEGEGGGGGGGGEWVFFF